MRFDIIRHHTKGKRLFSGIRYVNWGINDWVSKLLKISDSCYICGSKKDLQAHHLIKYHSYDELFLDVNNGVILCQSCHSAYHGFADIIDRETFEEFCKTYKPKKKRIKSFKKKRKKPKKIVKKIKKTQKPKSFKKKKKDKKQKKIPFRRLLVPIVTEELGTDEYEYLQKINLEKRF